MTSLAESEGVRRARHFCALERRLFEVLGGWVSSVPEPEAKLLLRVHSFRHASHADLWADLLPVGEDGSSVVIRPAVAGALDRLAEPTATVERLVAAYRVLLPQLEATYSSIRDTLSEASGGPEGRALDLILADDRQACRAGEALLDGLLGGPEDVDVGDAAGAVGRMQAAVDAAGGLDAKPTA